MKVVKNDNVLVLSGNNKGKSGRVLKVLPQKNRIIVEGINFIKKHARPTQKNPQGGIIEKEASIHVSNVMVICPKCNTPTRVGNKILDNGKKIRVCKNCGEMFATS
ncbi:MAG: 50S ribosomal protein L24 [bacterium]|jgi:large subunit ribosomal protein L24